MSNFGRAVRLALAYRATFAVSIVCAVMVAVLWGGNIGTVYPFVEVVLERRSLDSWFGDEITAYERQIVELQSKAASLAALSPWLDEAARRATSEEVRRALRLADQKRVTVERFDWFRRNVVQPYVPNDPFMSLVAVVALLVTGTVVKSLFQIADQVLVNRLAQLASFNLRKELYRKSLKMDLSRFTADGASSLMSRFTYDMESLSIGLTEFFGKLVREPLKMIACLAGAAWVSWRLLVLSLVIAPVAAFLIRWLARVLKRANRRAMEEMSEMYGILEETFQGIKVVRAFSGERHERRRFHHNSKQFFRKIMRIVRYDVLTRPLTEVMGILTISLALLAGAHLVLNQQTHLLGIRICDEPPSLSMLLLFYGLLAGVSDPFRKMSEVFNRIQRGAAAADRIYQVIDQEPAIVDSPRALPLPRHHREVAIEHVTFGYSSEQMVIEDVSLTIPFGKTVALVGPNGCGKTTLASLVPRFFDPVQGAVTVDGVDIRQVRMRDLRRQIGLVTQETLLFNDTVWNNIRYGSPSATRDQIIEAAKRAHAHRFITERLEDGYDTVVGSRGNRLSGGQRQRIALARAILRDPAILILDEATSQIDLESEQLIHRALEQFVHDRTTIIITHRLETLALADQIVVMELGRIVAAGTHHELLRSSPLYQRLHDVQFRESA